MNLIKAQISARSFQALFSLYKYDKSGYSHTAAVTFNATDVPHLHSMAAGRIERWTQVAEDWMEHGSDVHFIAYEDVVADPVEQMRRMLRHLGIEEEEERLRCLGHHLEGSFHRKRKSDGTEAGVVPFPAGADVTLAIEEAIRTVGERLKEKVGFELPLDHYNTDRINRMAG